MKLENFKEAAIELGLMTAGYVGGNLLHNLVKKVAPHFPFSDIAIPTAFTAAAMFAQGKVDNVNLRTAFNGVIFSGGKAAVTSAFGRVSGMLPAALTDKVNEGLKGSASLGQYSPPAHGIHSINDRSESFRKSSFSRENVAGASFLDPASEPSSPQQNFNWAG